MRSPYSKGEGTAHGDSRRFGHCIDPQAPPGRTRAASRSHHIDLRVPPGRMAARSRRYSPLLLRERAALTWRESLYNFCVPAVRRVAGKLPRTEQSMGFPRNRCRAWVVRLRARISHAAAFAIAAMRYDGVSDAR